MLSGKSWAKREQSLINGFFATKTCSVAGLTSLRSARHLPSNFSFCLSVSLTWSVSEMSCSVSGQRSGQSCSSVILTTLLSMSSRSTSSLPSLRRTRPHTFLWLQNMSTPSRGKETLLETIPVSAAPFPPLCDSLLVSETLSITPQPTSPLQGEAPSSRRKTRK
jgi:hypothetical protein